ncbi:alpha/beta hydrolase [Microtetraspora sp. NBRC 16547]|uniref:alpha/beta hydrolase n=1 Tax=Microtetraspora sp. NBRC 16547 TaxID=3030993 RepID=UPI0024A2DE20|nr:alpha/beta hydrolase [Microtetraspora sp. NBRC 16547]GLW97841.1 peptidase [Microtetraspora sp. NBRC 16547]
MSPKFWHIAISGIVALAATGCGPGRAQITPTHMDGVSIIQSPQSLTWGACEGVPASAGFQCATLKVPLDYSHPEGQTIGIALVRHPATDKQNRIGSLVFNFGGPGGSGVSTLLDAAFAFATLNKRYDLVSFDPRGVDRSSGIRCMDSAELERYLASEPSADTTEETHLLKGFAKACEQNAGPILPYVGTLNAARDLETMRAALGDEHLNYLGFSYGTHLGALYATQYPKQTGRMVLDSALDPSVGMLETATTQVRGFQKAYGNYLNACVGQPKGCPIGKTTASANAAVLKLIDSLEAHPAQSGGRTVTATVARTAVAQALYSKMAWPLLTEALHQAMKGDTSGLLALADQYGGRRPDGSYSTLQMSLPAILCADTTARPSIEEAERVAHDLKKESPIFAITVASSGICSVWPVPGEDTNRHIDASGANPIVVVGVTHDPATPFQWAPRLTEQLRSAVLVTLKGEGHGAYGQNNRCVDNAVNSYLLNGKVPPKGLVCG